MIPSQNALDLIKRFESCKLDAYQDPVGIWTVGFGSTGPGIVEGLTISQKTADGMLLGHVREVGLELTDLLGNFQLNQNQLDALTSLVYNIGIGNFKSSTLLKYLKMNDYKDASNEILKWNHAGGIVLPGLTTRRLAEQALFNKTV
jgi:lysozyme